MPAEFAGRKFRRSLSRPRQKCRTILDYDLRRSRAQIVVGGHRIPVGPGIQHGEQISGFRRGQRAVFSEQVAGLAHPAHDIEDPIGTRAAGKRHDAMPGPVQRRPQEVVHPAVDDAELSGSGLLGVKNPHHQGSGGAEERPPRLENEGGIRIGEFTGRDIPERSQHRFRIDSQRDLVFSVAVRDTESATDIQNPHRDLGAAQAGEYLAEPLGAPRQGRHVADLGPRVGVNSKDLHPSPVAGPFGDIEEVRRCHPELGGGGSRGDFGVGRDVHSGIQTEERASPETAS